MEDRLLTRAEVERRVGLQAKRDLSRHARQRISTAFEDRAARRPVAIERN